MSPLNSFVGNEQSKAITEEALPESQKVAQGNSAQPQIEAAPHQTTPPSSSSAPLEQPSRAEVAREPLSSDLVYQAPDHTRTTNLNPPKMSNPIV
ncbi:hypothetical protein [Edaphobacter modestus]|uniref:Uncharacterized protein n=1 Tax=Edaphobacter modestus TaxID=388466 RepID=A0A4Q7Z195_9BACT|nr:hypothetical protein [Edaphobacter modestus]RZU43269.1 hypothetical protein BDD14_4923 [Edaphobacter modestus]